MNWPRLILDGLAMSLLFNAVVGVGFLIYPQAYSTMFPKEIKKAASAYVDRRDVGRMNLIIYPLYLFMFVYWGISAHYAGVSGFWPLFWTGYLEMIMVSTSDFLILDCWLPPKAKPFIKGAENCKAWERKEWLLKLGIPEHAIVWPVFFCPVAALIVTGIGVLMG